MEQGKGDGPYTHSFANGNSDPNAMPGMTWERRLLADAQQTFWALV
jgi:hypothetical protein